MPHSKLGRNGFKGLALTAVLSLAITVRGQSPGLGGAKKENAPDYSKEAFVIESLRTTTTFENDGTGTREIAARVRVQSEAGVEQWGLLNVGYSSANEELVVGYVRVRKSD